MTTRNIAVFLALFVAVACGRTTAERKHDGGEDARDASGDTSRDTSSLADAGQEATKDVGGPPDIRAEHAPDAGGRLDGIGDLGTPVDLPLEQDADTPPDLVLGPEASRPPDSASGADAADAPPARFACSALAPLATKGPLSPRITNSVLFTQDRSAVVLQVKGTSTSASDDVLLVRLPAGDITPIASGVYSTEWLAPGETLLLRTSDGRLLAASLDGAAPTVLASQWSCDHNLSPDGKRLFSFPGSCSMAVHPLDMIDTATGATTTISTTASLAGGAGKGVVLSPSGAFAAFLSEQRLDSGTRGLVVHVLDRAGQDYAIASQPGASYPAFVSDDLLVFQENVSGDPARLELRGHIPGSGDQSYLIATGRDYQAFLGYRFSRDGKQVLGAKYDSDPSLTATDLLAISLDGSEELLLASDLFPYWSISMMIDAFSLAGDGSHVVYPIRDSGSSPAFSLATVPLGGGPAGVLGATLEHASSPVGDLVALTENGSSAGRLGVLDFGKEQWICEVKGAAMSSPAFLPDGRGLVFAEYTAAGSGRLLYLSVPGCTQVELAKLDSDRRPDASASPKAGFGVVDPTSCFAIVQSNEPTNAGTSLILLPE